MEDLNDDDLAELEIALTRIRDALQTELAGDGAREATVELDQTAVGRVSRIDALQQQQMAAAERRRSEIRLMQVQRAFKALADGSYGACARCGEAIGRKRLLARPEAPFCVQCATELGT